MCKLKWSYLHNPSFNGVLGYKFVDIDRLSLSHAMSARESLFLDSRIPPKIKQNNVVAFCKIES